MKRSKIHQSGQVLIGVLMLLVLILLIIPPLVSWIQSEAQWSVKQQKVTTALNLASAGIERGIWKLKSSTSTWNQAAAGTVIAGYNFDVTHRDIEGGSYRIKFTAGPSAYQVTIVAEGRDSATAETKAVQGIYQNQAIPGPILAGGNLTLSDAFEPHWGPVMAQGNITISGAAASRYYPRKYSKQTVTGIAGNLRDTNGMTPPNTDNQEWWSAYAVPDLPLLDFTTMRASAAVNGTLNYYNVNASSTGHVLTGYSGGHTNACETPTGGAFGSHANHFYDSQDHPKSKQNLIWYWDGDLILTGTAYLDGTPLIPCHRMGLYGTIIVRGNLTIYTEDCYEYTAPVPTEAWREYARIDTALTNQYPADNGLRTNRSTFILGTDNWTGGPASADYTDVGIRGFLYVGGNFTIASNALADFAGAIWTVGNVTNNNAGEKSLIFFDATLQVPVLNVVLVQQSWKEITKSSTVWAP